MLTKAFAKKKFYSLASVGGKAGVVIPPFAKSIVFTGSNWIQTSTATGLTTTNGKKYLVSFWYRATGGFGGFNILFENASNDGLSISRFPSGLVYVQGQDSSNANVATVGTVDPIADDSTWHHIMITGDVTGTPIAQVALDGVLATSSFAQNPAGTINFARANTHTIGSRSGGIPTTAHVAELWIAHNQTLDLSVSANIQKFRSLAGHPVDLGAAGATPTGTAATCYFSVRTGGVANDFLTNRGTGGQTWVMGSGTLSLGVDP